MKNKKFIFVVFSVLLLASVGAFFAVQLFFGFEHLSVISPETDEIGKIKYVDINGNDVFASSSAVVFSNPISVSSVVVDGDVAQIEVSEFSICRAPAYGVVTRVENGTIEIDHGNNTKSVLSGLSNVAVCENQIVFACQPIGATTKSVSFSVSVDDLPLDMQWLLGINEDENYNDI